MEILVCVKRVPDSAENEISVGPGGADMARDDLVYSVNEWDNYAVAEAIQIVEREGPRSRLAVKNPRFLGAANTRSTVAIPPAPSSRSTR